MQAPLTQPGVNAKVGDYILAVNGRELHAQDNIYGFFEETAGKQVVLKIGANPDGKDSRETSLCETCAATICAVRPRISIDTGCSTISAYLFMS